jgi:hypothetical protein
MQGKEAPAKISINADPLILSPVHPQVPKNSCRPCATSRLTRRITGKREAKRSWNADRNRTFNHVPSITILAMLTALDKEGERSFSKTISRNSE